MIYDSLVTCILMHERFNLGACLTISCNKLHATISGFVQQVARYDPRFRATSCTLRSTINPRMERNKVRWFLREFFQTTHYQPSRALFISCNELHATIYDSPVACILMHDRTTHGTLFTLSEYSRFRATSCTLRSTTKPRTERYLTLFRHFRFRATSCTLRGLFLI